MSCPLGRQLTPRFTFLNNVKWPLFAKYDSPQLYGLAREVDSRYDI